MDPQCGLKAGQKSALLFFLKVFYFISLNGVAPSGPLSKEEKLIPKKLIRSFDVIVELFHNDHIKFFSFLNTVQLQRVLCRSWPLLILEYVCR